MNETVKNNIKNKLMEQSLLLPQSSGCYLMKNKYNQVIYVGKAKNLRTRVQSYFNESVKSHKTEVLVSHIVQLEFILTQTDAESFILENNLIKKYAPKYNIRLKDDRSYPYVLVNHNEKFKKFEYIRKAKRKKGIEVFGPFVTGSNISEILMLLNKIFLLRDCSNKEFKKRIEPCLLYQLKQCSAPCVLKIEEITYNQQFELARNIFLNKESNKTLKFIESKMHSASENEEFENAIFYREALQKLNEFKNNFTKINVEISSEKNVDIIGNFIGEKEIEISIYMIRNGLLLVHKNFHFNKEGIDNDYIDLILNHVFQYYSLTEDSWPNLIITDFTEENNHLLKNALHSLELNVLIKNPFQEYISLMEVTKDHALNSQKVRLQFEENEFFGLDKLKDLLGLSERPLVLECFDIAIFQGKSPTASQIVFHEGKPDKKNYRHYHLQELNEGNNDFAMMKELISRRIDNGQLPDVFIVDGGIGQVNSFLEILRETQINIPVVGIAKAKVKSKTHSFKNEKIQKSEERLIIPGRLNPYILKNNKALFKIIIQMRDEAHRFSRRLHHKEESNRVFNRKSKR